MVRKSSKTNAAADKPTRKRRGTRRRKDSSSESEPEVSQAGKEENVSSIALPKDPPAPKEEGDELDTSGRRKRGSKRSATSKDDAPQEESAVDNTSEWNEDETFWSGVVSNPASNIEVVNEDEGSTWKIQSSNGSGGEIQKLKICRQRPTDSTGSSSPAKECASPRMKNSSRTSGSEKIDGENTELEADAPMDIVDVENDKVQPEQIPIINTSVETTLAQPIVEEPVEAVAATVPTDSSISSSCTVGEMKVEADEIIIPGLDLVSDGQKQQDQLWITPQPVVVVAEVAGVSMIEMPPAKEESLQVAKETEISEEVVSNVECISENQENIPVTDPELESIKNINLPPVEEMNVVVDTTSKEDEDEEEENEEVAGNKPTIVESQENTIGEETDEKKPTSKCLAGSLPVSSELAMEQIAKKLNERAARGKEMLDEKEKTKIAQQHSRENSPELDRSIEEGEILSSAAATPDPQPSAKTAKATTVVIKPKEVVCLPTKLKRNIEESPPPQGRKRRVSKKRLCFSPQISITSDLLKELMPEEILNAVAAAANDEDDEIDNESDVGEDIPVQTEEITEPVDETETKKPSPAKFETKHDDVEVTVSVSDDVREVKKKVPIVIDTKSPPSSKGSQGPKLPSAASSTTSVVTTQENHKAIRKISIVSADAKALRKSPSPSRKKATEVLFITNLVRPFTVPQLRELLARTGTIAQNGFYIDKIKSKCYVKYTDIEMAIETRHALHGVRWPVNNPKTLRVDFALPEDMAVVQKLADEEAGAAAKKQENDVVAASGTVGGTGSSGWLNEQAALKPSRRVTATVREWDMGKVVGGETGVTKSSPPITENKKKTEDDWNRKREKPSRPEKERDRRRAHSPEHNKAEPPKKLKKKEIDAPAKLLDDLFRKTKATPCIYWLPLTAAQIAVKEEIRRQHMAEHERRLAELRKTDASGSRRDKERERERDRDRRKK